MTEKQTLSGGCQCGAVRYHMLQRPTDPNICNCRMCQKHFGSFYAAFVKLPKAKLHLTRGKISFFQSSEYARRGFCKDCGTPLTFDPVESKNVFIATATMDDYSGFAPLIQYGIESRPDFVQRIHALPEFTSVDGPDDHRSDKSLPAIQASNKQHPDHDTKDWPVKGK